MIRNLKIHKPMNSKIGYIALLLSFYLLSYILPLGTLDLTVPDETRYAEIPREMIANWDWVVPHLNGLRYFEKPVLGYWVHAGSLLLFGENSFAVRFPSALAVGLSALLIYILARRVLRSKDEDYFPAVLACLIFLSCFEIFGVGNTAVLDNLFSLFLTASIAAFYFAVEEKPGSRKQKGFLLLAGLSCGLAFLTKGFLAFVIPWLVLVPYLAWQRRYSDIFRLSWLPFIVAVLVVLPWGVAIHQREPDFWRFFIWNEHIRRFMADNAQHKRSFWFFTLAAPALFFPWSSMIPATIPGLKARLSQTGDEGRLLRYCFCWLVMPFLFFSLSKGKILTYILPCFPPFAVLVAFGLSHILDKTSRDRLFQGGIAVSAVLFGLILVAFLFVQFHGFNGFGVYTQTWKAVMLINGLVFSLLFCLWASQSARGKEKALIFGMSPLLLFFIIHYTIPDQVIDAKSPGVFLEEHGQEITDGDIIISDKNSVSAVCLYFKRSDLYVLGYPGELQYGLGYRDALRRSLTLQSASDLINRNRGKIVLIARAENVSRWWSQLPRPISQDQNSPFGYAMWKF